MLLVAQFADRVLGAEEEHSAKLQPLQKGKAELSRLPAAVDVLFDNAEILCSWCDLQWYGWDDVRVRLTGGGWYCCVIKVMSFLRILLAVIRCQRRFVGCAANEIRNIRQYLCGIPLKHAISADFVGCAANENPQNWPSLPVFGALATCQARLFVQQKFIKVKDTYVYDARAWSGLLSQPICGSRLRRVKCMIPGIMELTSIFTPIEGSTAKWRVFTHILMIYWCVPSVGTRGCSQS